MTSRRELQLAVALCLVGSAAVLVAASRSWLALRLPAAAPLPSHTLSVSGAHLAPGARPLALLGLSGVAALLATRKLGRLVVGALVLAAGAGVVAVIVRVLVDPARAVARSEPFRLDPRVGGSPDLGAWPYLALLGGVLIAAGGLLIAVRGRRWATLSARYDAPATPEPVGEASLWAALDRGEDPTAGATSDPH
jgi:uncharacterized membrane protein (TIGR02234 family)